MCDRSQGGSCPWSSEVMVGRRGFWAAGHVLFLIGAGYRAVFSGRKFMELYTYALWNVCSMLYSNNIFLKR